MILIYVVLFAGIFEALGSFVDKRLANMGISKHNYFYYMCLTMIPFALVMLMIEYFTRQLKFQFSVVAFLLLILAMFLRYYKQHTIIGCLRYLNPYEDSAYLSLGIVIAFILDVILGIESLGIVSILSIIMTLVGVFFIANSKLKIQNLRKDLVIRIFTSLALSYVTYFILNYWSNAVFILILNLFLSILFAKDYSFQSYQKNKRVLKWCFIQQIFGFSALYLSNYLASNSVTLSSYVRPTSILVIFIISMFVKDSSKKPTVKQAFGMILVILGVLFIN